MHGQNDPERSTLENSVQNTKYDSDGLPSNKDRKERKLFAKGKQYQLNAAALANVS